ncbi:gamma-glutamyl-gamma-aminobutyrate hydrolase family protein [Solihabitans fulvus]|uniref:Gamma-glutamyl-gamma-aminobutyrate hydrolase family protein n=1 Tax=Solihabitans fulvus TaxID=1892852 RepID=A0A5B2WZR2_9PSEU|nr:gamma-glutamyl-gamma-aminobutyrate hydrolase family protein [Solihabitans fulvus]KAA2256096.1 gamma-glutamyl-gamma-aminobutyrate hydrolase family protein [Solihabitans fulvus]
MASNGSDRRPVIGVSTYLEPARYGVWDVEAALLHRNYVDLVALAGGNPILLPPVGDWQDQSVALLDGLVLAGGADLDPASYGRPAHPRAGAAQAHRDRSEFALLSAALAADLPLLGVCRGMQILNVALGGTLHQHLPDRLDHRDHQPAPGVFGETGVVLDADSRLGGLLGERAAVRCHHHQAIDAVAPRLRVVGRAADGTVEAVELPDADFAIGVQWHPEQDLTDVRLLTALVRAAHQHSRAKRSVV